MGQYFLDLGLGFDRIDGAGPERRRRAEAENEGDQQCEGRRSLTCGRPVPQALAELAEGQVHIPAFQVGPGIDIKSEAATGVKRFQQGHGAQITDRQAPEQPRRWFGAGHQGRSGLREPSQVFLRQIRPDAQPQPQDHRHLQQQKQLHETKGRPAAVAFQNAGAFLVEFSGQALQHHHRHGKTPHAGQPSPQQGKSQTLTQQTGPFVELLPQRGGRSKESPPQVKKHHPVVKWFQPPGDPHDQTRVVMEHCRQPSPQRDQQGKPRTVNPGRMTPHHRQTQVHRFRLAARPQHRRDVFKLHRKRPSRRITTMPPAAATAPRPRCA